MQFVYCTSVTTQNLQKYRLKEHLFTHHDHVPVLFTSTRKTKKGAGRH